MTYYHVTYETMDDDVSLIVEDTVNINIDPMGDIVTQLRRELRRIHPHAHIADYVLDDEDVAMIDFS